MARCQNHSIPGVVAGQQCGLESGHHGHCFWAGEFSVKEMEARERPDAAPPKDIVEAADRVIDKLQQAAAVQDGVAPPPSDAAPDPVVGECIDRIAPKAQDRNVQWEDRDRLDIAMICCELVMYRQGWKAHPPLEQADAPTEGTNVPNEDT